MSCKVGDKVLFRTPTTTIPPEVQTIREKVGITGEVIVVAEGEALPQNSTFDTLVSIASSAQFHPDSFFGEALKILKPNGQFIIREPLLINESSSTLPLRTEKQIRTALTIAGFVNIRFQIDTKNASIAAFDGGIQAHIATAEITCSKPNWELGAKQTLSFKPQTTNVWKLSEDDTVDADIPVAVKPVSGATAWKISAEADDDADMEYEDESSLLKEEDFMPNAKKPKLGEPDDCDFGKGGARKACKNCTCGRAEGKIPVEKTVTAPAPTIEPTPVAVQQPRELPKSSCGNCALGDAFRCGGCPYRGLPAFKEGDKVVMRV